MAYDPPNEIESLEATRGELLLVDDSPSSLTYLSSVLTQAGYQVREAPSGELALMTLQVRTPELILLDVRMPNMDGFEVCRRLKASEATKEIPVIFLSAQDEVADKVLGLKIGAVDFIGKTFALEEMLARIDTHVTLVRVKKTLEWERARLEDRVLERTEALRQSQSLLMTVIDSGPGWIYAIDRSHRYLLVNHIMATKLGYADAGELIGRYDCEAFPRDGCFKTAHEPECLWHDDERAVFAGRNVYHANECITLPTGQKVNFETHKTPLRDKNDIIYGALVYRRDITQRLKMEQENRGLERALWQAKKMEIVGQLAGGIAHDFNHLLSLILGYAQFAQTALANGKTEKLNDYLSEVMKAGTEGQMVVSQLLAFSRTPDVADKAIDTGPVVEEVVDSFRQMPEFRAKLNLTITPELAPAFIKAIQLKQVVNNLLLNARDALGNGDQSKHGRIDVRLFHIRNQTIQVCVSCQKQFQGDYLALEVKDNGAGMAAEIKDKIFYPFFTTKDIGKGSGLGLPMVHGIVHSVGGHVGMESTPSAGTTFLVWLPVEKERP